ncbi:MAG TPA: GNAT family N-acetyltransferase [Pyrinomonadaceae bacterium]|jgi:GNAT superfamily N-acetyltransferase
MKITRTVNLSSEQKQRIVELWNNEYPVRLRHSGTASLDEYLSKLGNPEHYLLTDDAGNIKGWLACFVRDEEKWFAMIVDTSEQKKGYGSRLLDAVKEFETEISGWAIDHETDVKANGEAYRSPLGFYEKNGFEILSDIRLETDAMSAVRIKWRVK